MEPAEQKAWDACNIPDRQRCLYCRFTLPMENFTERSNICDACLLEINDLYDQPAATE